MTVRWRLMISCSFNVKLYLKVHTLHLWEDSLVMPLIIRTAGMCLYYIFKRTHGSTLSQTFLKWRTTFALCKHRLQKALSEKPIISSMLLLVTIFFFFWASINCSCLSDVELFFCFLLPILPCFPCFISCQLTSRNRTNAEREIFGAIFF